MRAPSADGDVIVTCEEERSFLAVDLRGTDDKNILMLPTRRSAVQRLIHIASCALRSDAWTHARHGMLRFGSQGLSDAREGRVPFCLYARRATAYLERI